MIQEGLIEEVEAILMGKGFGPESGRAIGYKQVIAHLNGEISLQEAEDQINMATLRFAKKQLTWYKRFEQIRWFEINKTSDKQAIARKITGYFMTGQEE
jgi:tRNA dimethylallyltransferase